ncbi:MAG: oligosaccharide flippase family protein [Bacteroidales bacterium]|nr:oligosaccharide flippase family protein [Bacteroidales bacterium]
MIDKLLKNDFWKNIVTLLSASLLAQAIPFLLLPILQKWFFTPSDFGLLAIYTSISLLLAGIASFKYELAIVNADSDTEAQNILKGAVILVLLSTLLSTILLLFFKESIASIFQAEDLGSFILLIPFSVLFVGLYEVLVFWNNRKQNYKAIAGSKITKSAFAESSKLILGKSSIGGGLIIGRIIGEFISLVYLVINFIKNDLKSITSYNVTKVKESLNKHYRFPSFSMPSVFVGNMINVVFIGLISRYFGQDSAGIIGVSVVYIAVAFGIMSQAFSQVFFKEIHQKKSKQELLSFYLNNAAILSVATILVITLVEIMPSGAVSYILGEQWGEMMPTLKILVFAYGAQFITSSLSFIYIRLSKQKTMLIFDILHLAMVWGSIIIAYNYFGSFHSTIIAYTIAQVLYYFIAFMAAIIFINKSKLQQ